MIAVLVVIDVAALAYGHARALGQAREHASEHVAGVSEFGAHEIEAALENGAAQVATLVAQPSLGAVFATPEGCSLVIDAGIAFPGARLGIIDPAGREVCSSSPDIDGSAGLHRESRWLSETLAAGGVIQVWDDTDGLGESPVAVIAAPIASSEAAPSGAVALFLPVTPIAGALEAAGSSSAGTTLTLVQARTGTVLSTGGDQNGGGSAPFDVERGTGVWDGPDGTERLFASTPIAASPWRLYAGEDWQQATAAARAALVHQTITGLAVLAALLLAGVVLHRRIATPLRELTRAVDRAAQDQVVVRVNDAGAAEVARLAQRFNMMLDVRSGQEARLLHAATHDPVTSLPNVVLARERINDALDSGGTGVGVLRVGLTDIEDLQAIVGVDGVERVLVEVARRVQLTLSSVDTLARSGDLDLLAVCPGLTTEAGQVLAEVILAGMAEPINGVQIHLSIGITTSRAGSTVSSLLREAATAQLAGRSSGRAATRFEPAMRDRAIRSLDIEQALRLAPARGELLLHYQPVVAVGTGQVIGAEALVRWNRPGHGLVPPMDFIPVAEATGQIGAIGDFVLKEACAQAARWRAQGRDLRISVNVTAAQLDEPGFDSRVALILQEAQLPAQRLCVEVTESVLVSGSGRARDTLERLRRLRVDVAIDDFGTGYSSLSYLSDLPVTEIKVDRSFVARLDEVRTAALVESVVRMSRAMELTVVAEGVETADQLALLGDLGCDLVQGFYFSRPLPAHEFLVAAAQPAST